MFELWQRRNFVDSIPSVCWFWSMLSRSVWTDVQCLMANVSWALCVFHSSHSVAIVSIICFRCFSHFDVMWNGDVRRDLITDTTQTRRRDSFFFLSHFFVAFGCRWKFRFDALHLQQMKNWKQLCRRYVWPGFFGVGEKWINWIEGQANGNKRENEWMRIDTRKTHKQKQKKKNQRAILSATIWNWMHQSNAPLCVQRMQITTGNRSLACCLSYQRPNSLQIAGAGRSNSPFFGSHSRIYSI